MQISENIVWDGLAAHQNLTRFEAYRWKMILLALFILLNIVFLSFIIIVPSNIVSYVFFAYVALSALPKFVFGSVLHRFKWFVEGKPTLAKTLEDEEIEDFLHGVKRKRWFIAGSKGDYPKKTLPVLVSACVTVHHEDTDGLDAGVRSWETCELPFEAEQLQVVYIVDGRHDRNGALDSAQEKTARFLLSRLCCLGEDFENTTYVNEDGVVYANSENLAGPTLLQDGTAMYKGRIRGRKGGIPFVMLYKDRNGGKRNSHQMFFEMTDQRILQRPLHGIFFVDSDVKFSWNGHRKSFARLYKGLMEFERVGGAAGEIEVWRWIKNPIALLQFFEYKSNQFLSKTFESFFGMVTCLPGAFCMVRPQAMEMVLNKYLSDASSVFEKNKLDLGEDRTLTTLILEAGWSTVYVPAAVAKTDVPATILQLMRQRRRWINSTVVNMYTLLHSVRRLSAIPLILSLGVELFSSYVLPTAILSLFYEMGLSFGVNGPLVIGFLVLWVVALVIVSISASTEGSMWLYEHSTYIGGFIEFLMILQFLQNLAAFTDKFFMEIVVMVGWVACVVGASIIHKQWSSVFCLIAPFCWFILSPLMYVVIPIYATCNFDDVSWGTRGN